MRRCAGWLCALLWLCGCGTDSGESWPEGTLLLGRSEAVERLLGRLAQLEGTPLGRLAETTRAALPDCAQVTARTADGGVAELAAGLACLETPGDLAPLERARGEHDLALAVPLADGARAVLTLSVREGGDVDAELSLPDDVVTGLPRLLVPGRDAPGAPLLSGRERLTHVRLRPADGIDVASLVPAGSQADELFRLKSGLFAGVVLDGTWEAALYLPEAGRRMPRAALALGFRNRTAAVGAMERFVSDLASIWPVHRTALRLGEASGACLLELRLLPELSPCYVATDDALVMGWNPESLRRALDGTPADLPTERGGAFVDLARFHEADLRLAGAEGADVRSWPWQRIVADGTSEGGRVRIQLALRTGPEA